MLIRSLLIAFCILHVLLALNQSNVANDGQESIASSSNEQESKLTSGNQKESIASSNNEKGQSRVYSKVEQLKDKIRQREMEMQRLMGNKAVDWGRITMLKSELILLKIELIEAKTVQKMINSQ